AWDYLGEAGIGAWSYPPDGQAFNKPYPWLLADVGAIDILGNIGAEAEYAATVWGLRNKPYIAVRPLNHPGITAAKSVWRGTNAIPSWSWKNCEGNKTIVEVYSNSDIVELFINGKSIGKKKTKNFKAYFKVKYTPGNITAAAYNSSGTETGRTQLLSAAGKIKICLKPEKNNAKAGEIVYVDVSLIGENGIIESNADAKINVFIENGELLAFGSANPRTEENYLSGSFTTYYGRALAVVLCKNSGKTIIHATALNMEETHAEIVII
ncbi:MAG: DUF4982 domain-containing protein, partial [Oscillospiraceae bacterium]|nr:DUF4982 domain-containing protein [Oscillospiraceae bacterium]